MDENKLQQLRDRFQNYRPDGFDNQIMMGVMSGLTMQQIADTLPPSGRKPRKHSFVSSRLERLVGSGYIEPPVRQGSKAYAVTAKGIGYLSGVTGGRITEGSHAIANGLPKLEKMSKE